MRFFKETLVPVNRPLLVLERELPLPDSFCLIAATSKTGGAAATDVEAAGCEEGSGGAEVWANDLTASNASNDEQHLSEETPFESDMFGCHEGDVSS